MADFLIIATTAVAQNLNDPHEAEGMPHTGSEAIESEAGGIGHGNAPDPAALGLDGTAWVSLAMAIFIAILIWKKVPGLIVGGLDRQIVAIRTRLDEAKALRAEAEALREEYARKIANAEKDAAMIVEQARAESQSLVAKAEADAAELVQRRTRMAEDKIAAAERTALAEIRAKTAEAAAAAAARLIAERHDAGADKALVDRTIAGLNSVH